MLVTWRAENGALNKKGTILRERIVQIMPDVIISAAEPILPVLGSGITTSRRNVLVLGFALTGKPW